MKLLIIDNESRHTQEIVSSCIAFLGIRPDVMAWSQVTFEIARHYNKIVLSGSSTYSVRTFPEVYATQREIIKKSTAPILGICAGFELICTAFDSPLVRNEKRIQGIHQISMTSSDILTTGYKTMSVYEGHNLVCESLHESLVELARSDSGIEIIKHKAKPIYGVQFHPEVSSPSNDGNILLERFLTLV